MAKFKFNLAGDFDKASQIVDLANKFTCDINVIDGSKIFDCKSFIAFTSLDLKKDLEIEVLSFSETTCNTFAERLKEIIGEANE